MEEKIYKIVQESLNEQQQELQEQQQIQILTERVDEIDSNYVPVHSFVIIIMVFLVGLSFLTYVFHQANSERIDELEEQVKILENCLEKVGN